VERSYACVGIAAFTFIQESPFTQQQDSVHIVIREGSEAYVGTTVGSLCRTSMSQRSATFWPMRVFNNVTFVIKRITDIMSVNRYGTNLTVNALLKTTLLDLKRHSRGVCSKTASGTKCQTESLMQLTATCQFPLRAQNNNF